MASERAALLADICARLEAARRAGERARFPGDWDPDSNDYLNYLLILTTDLRRQCLAALPTEKLWEILTLLAYR